MVSENITADKFIEWKTKVIDLSEEMGLGADDGYIFCMMLIGDIEEHNNVPDEKSALASKQLKATKQ